MTRLKIFLRRRRKPLFKAAVLKIFTIKSIHLQPLLRKKVGSYNVVHELPAPPRLVVEKGFGGQEHGRYTEMNCYLKAGIRGATNSKILESTMM
jgi:hypothetical protein